MPVGIAGMLKPAAGDEIFIGPHKTQSGFNASVTKIVSREGECEVRVWGLEPLPPHQVAAAKRLGVGLPRWQNWSEWEA